MRQRQDLMLKYIQDGTIWLWQLQDGVVYHGLMVRQARYMLVMAH